MSRKSIETLILCFILSVCILVLYIHKKPSTENKISKPNKSAIVKEETGALDNPGARSMWEYQRLRDPSTGRIPSDIRSKELGFVSNLPKDIHYKLKSVVWTNRGPYNVGGRTRALALDKENEDIIIAGGVSGGIWRTIDGGKVWNEQTSADQLHSVSCIAQDVRPGKRNIWYYGTGELIGDSPSSAGAFFLGNGVFKSIDNGISWNSLTSTALNTPSDFTDMWAFVWNIAVDPTKHDSDVVYSASLGTIFQSINGGNSWKTVLGGGLNYSWFSDIAVTSHGVLYATLGKESSFNSKGGIYRSVNGVKWSKITPALFPKLYNRVIIAVNPSEENEVYFLGVSQNEGVLSHSYLNRSEWLTFWKYQYLSGDGTGTNGIWTDLTQNLPVYYKNVFNNFYTQGAYDMTIKVKPDDSKVVIIGGTNLYRSTDAFATKNNITQIGGYEIDTKFPDFNIYINHHPDQHNLAFLPSDPNVMISANDAGIFKTNNCLNNIVEWESLNRGYSTTQLYTVSMDEETNSDLILAGFQDNGNYFTNSADPKKSWVLPLNGDGSFSSITKGGEFFYISKQEGKTYKMTLNSDGTRNSFSRIDPIGGKNFLFVNPFIVDPNDDNIMYMAGGRKLWRNDSLNFIPLNNTYDSISKGWYVFPDSLTTPDTSITAVAVSKNPSNIVYYGTNQKNIYRIDSANTLKSKRTLITGSSFPIIGNNEGAYVSCIAVDPEDANKVFVVFSNYNIYSLFYTEDAGKKWIKVGGNLEPSVTGFGPGPSCRWVSILALPDNKRIYFLGTSTGLYATDKLVDHSSSDKTIWIQIGADVIGNVVVDMVKTRSIDNLILVATHGHGVYSAHINSYDEIQSVFESVRNKNADINIYPNPATNYINLSINISKPQAANILIFSRDGKLVKNIGNKELGLKSEKISIQISDLAQGIYYCIVQLEERIISKPFLVVK